MAESSIFADLRRYAGIIKATRLDDVAPVHPVVDEPVRADMHPDMHPDTLADTHTRPDTHARMEHAKPTNSAKPNLTIDEIAQLLKTVTPLKNEQGFIHDDTKIAAKCSRGHIHKYFLSDIVRGDEINCTTCTGGTKFTKMVHQVLETVFETPFIITDDPKDTSPTICEFVNPILKLSVSCSRKPANDNSEQIGDYTLVRLHPTTSAKKVRDALGEFLVNFPMADNIRAKIQIVKPAKKAPVKKEPLPITPDLAEVVGVVPNHSNDPALCIENC